MTTVIQGKDFLSFFRLLKEQATENAAKLRFETESTISKEKETEATPTKDGIINTVNNGENTAEFTSLAYVDDTETVEIWKLLEEAFDDNEIVEFWSVLLTGNIGGEVDAVYHQGYFTSFEISAPADGQVELSYSYAINGKPQKGEDTLTAEQLQAANNAQYEYETMQATGGAQ